MLRDGEFLAPALVPVSGQPVREPLRCRPDAAYLITGGMGALGLLMAAWLADRGARRLVLAGRTPLPPRRDWDSDTNDTDMRHKIAAIRALEMRGVSVDAVALDVGSRDAVQALLAKRDGDGAPPIRGVIHAAGVTESQLLTEIADSRLRRTMWPKIAGAQALHAGLPAGKPRLLLPDCLGRDGVRYPGAGRLRGGKCVSRLSGPSASPTRLPHRQSGLGGLAGTRVRALTRKSSCKSLNGSGSRPVTPEEAFAAWEHVNCYDVAQAVMAPMQSAEGRRVGPIRCSSDPNTGACMVTDVPRGSARRTPERAAGHPRHRTSNAGGRS